MKLKFLGTALSLTTALLLGACGNNDTTASTESPSEAKSSSASSSPDQGKKEETKEAKPNPAPNPAGQYVAFADWQADPASYENAHTVLFFNASWCPTCKEMRDWLASNDVPDGLTLVNVDYDAETELKQQYGVTVQHTFVEIDPDGAELKKWTGSVTGEDLLAEIA
jgi:thioredoxin 1